MSRKTIDERMADRQKREKRNTALLGAGTIGALATTAMLAFGPMGNDSSEPEIYGQNGEASTIVQADPSVAATENVTLSLTEIANAEFAQYPEEWRPYLLELREAEFARIAMQRVPEDLLMNREFILAAVQQHDWAFVHINKDFRADKGVVLAAVQRNVEALASASEELKSDREVVLVATQQNGMAIVYAADEFHNDRDLVLQSVKNASSFEYLQYLPDEYRADKEIMMAVVERDPFFLNLASAELRDDREVVLAAITRNGMALDFASVRLRNDEELSRIAWEVHEGTYVPDEVETTNAEEPVVTAPALEEADGSKWTWKPFIGWHPENWSKPNP